MPNQLFDNLTSIYDVAMLPLEALILQRLRPRLFHDLHGDVLEVGVGTGANFVHYPSDTCLMGVDESLEMLEVANQKARPCFSLAQADVQRMPFPRSSFDHIVCTLVFCSVADPLVGLRELHRILRPGGRLVLLEHVRGYTPLAAQITDLLNPFWNRFTRSCNLNRETARTVAAAGFTITHTERHAFTVFQIIEAVKESPLRIRPRGRVAVSLN